MEADIKDRLRLITNKKANELTDTDKVFVMKYASQYLKRRDCASCYIDAAVMAYTKATSELKKNETEHASNVGSDGVRLVLKDDTDVIFRGRYINAANITPELTEWLLENGFPKSYFYEDKQ